MNNKHKIITRKLRLSLNRKFCIEINSAVSAIIDNIGNAVAQMDMKEKQMINTAMQIATYRSLGISQVASICLKE